MGRRAEKKAGKPSCREWGRGEEKRKKRRAYRQDGGGRGNCQLWAEQKIHSLRLQRFTEHLLQADPSPGTEMLERIDQSPRLHGAEILEARQLTRSMAEYLVSGGKCQGDGQSRTKGGEHQKGAGDVI